MTELAINLGISQPATSRHLKILREHGLTKATRIGTSVIYTLTDYRLIEALNLLRLFLRDQLMSQAELLNSEVY